MSRLKKSIGLLLTVMLMIMSGALLLSNISSVVMPNQLGYLGFLPKPRGIVKTALSTSLFWLSLLVFMSLLLILLIILFYPKNKTQLDLKDNKGKLVLKTSAIDGLVKSVVAQKGFMSSPKVSSRLSKKKLHVYVKGNIIPRQAVVSKSEELKDAITQALQSFIGLNTPLGLKVEVAGIDERVTSSKPTSRVI